MITVQYGLVIVFMLLISENINGFFQQKILTLQSKLINTSRTQLNSFSLVQSSDSFRSISADPGLHIKIKGKALNLWGIYCAFVTFSIAVLVLPAFSLLSVICDVTGNGKKRRILDWIVHYWAKFSIILTLGNPKVLGKENIPSKNETVIYVPNHTSFLDILYLSGFVPRPCKYLSKAEIAKIPVIGQCMSLAKHVFLKRDDLVSTLEATSQSIQRLKDGNSMVLFAEGTRSLDGRLKAFKKGAFQIARETGAKIVPVSIGNLYHWMPNSALLPLAPMRDTYIRIHPHIDPAGKTVNQMKNLCLQAVNSGLPDHQKMLELKKSDSEDVPKVESSVKFETPVIDISKELQS